MRDEKEQRALYKNIKRKYNLFIVLSQVYGVCKSLKLPLLKLLYRYPFQRQRNMIFHGFYRNF